MIEIAMKDEVSTATPTSGGAAAATAHYENDLLCLERWLVRCWASSGLEVDVVRLPDQPIDGLHAGC